MMRSWWRHNWPWIRAYMANEEPSYENIVPVGTSRRFGMYRVSTVVEYLGTPPYITIADCGHCFQDTGERA